MVLPMIEQEKRIRDEASKILQCIENAKKIMENGENTEMLTLIAEAKEIPLIYLQKDMERVSVCLMDYWKSPNESAKTRINEYCKQIQLIISLLSVIPIVY